MATVVDGFLMPSLHILKTISVANVIDQEDSSSGLEVASGDAFVFLGATGIPDLQFDRKIIDDDGL